MIEEWIKGRKVLITGGSSGIGFETARALAARGAHVAIASRDAERTEAAAGRLRAEAGGEVRAYQVDLSSQNSVRDFARMFREENPYLDVLVNNAGAYFPRRRESADGIELTWALNHLGPFLLTAELMPLLRITEGARIVTVASDAHYRGRIHFADPEFATGYAGFKAYGQSKLANVMFTYALARRLEGSGIVANCLHPGVVASGFLRNVPVVGSILPMLMRPFMISNAQGAKTSVFLASSETVAGQSGGYYDISALAQSSAASMNAADQERLWALSIERTGAVYSI